MDLTHVRDIIGGTIEKLKLNLSRSQVPRTEQKLQLTEQKVT